MSLRAPIELELYNEQNEIVKKLSRLVVPWGILKQAVRLSKEIQGDDVSEAILDECASLVVQLFGETNVSIADLDAYADTADMINVIRQISERARGLVPNAPPAAR